MAEAIKIREISYKCVEFEAPGNLNVDVVNLFRAAAKWIEENEVVVADVTFYPETFGEIVAEEKATAILHVYYD